jgi:putative FmdB family regulatory protein
MPLYEYQCEACGSRFEVIHKFSDPPADTCKVCGKGPVQRLQSSPAIQFKGSGWYITDYARKGSSDSSRKGTDGKGSSDTKAADGKGDAGSKDAGSKSENTSKSDSSNTAKPAPASSSKE